MSKKEKLGLMTVLLLPIGIAINFIGGQIVALLKLPIFLDSIGTVLCGALGGPVAGAIAGLLTNLILGMTQPSFIPFAVVSIAVGIVAGFCGKKGLFKTIKGTILAAVFIWAITQLTATPISVLVFGGVTGSGSSVLTGFLVAAGQGLWEAAFGTSLITETVDKIVSVAVVYIIIKSIPGSTLFKFKLGPIYVDENQE